MKAQLAQAIREAGSAEQFARNQIKNLALEMTKRYGFTDQQATGLAKPMVLQLMGHITFGKEKQGTDCCLLQ